MSPFSTTGRRASAAIAIAALSGGRAFAPPPAFPAAASAGATSPLGAERAAREPDGGAGGAGGRRDVVGALAGGFAAGAALAGIFGAGGEASALDFDSFEKGLIEKDIAECNPKIDPRCIPKLTEDEALCKYGGGGTKKIEACIRVRDAGGQLPGGGKPGERQVKGWFAD